MSNKILFSIDVENDLHTNARKGIILGLKKIEELCDRHSIKPSLFVTGEVLEKNHRLFKILHKKGWEISCHGYSHRRFDDMNYSQKQEEIQKCLKAWKKHLNLKPKGFRAPQHSVDEETLDLLAEAGFEYDSSYAPLNFLQLFFFPRRFKNWIKICFSPLNTYHIRTNLKEIPTSSLFVPFVSLTVRAAPRLFLRPYVWAIKLFYKQPVFYAHSWDFIELPKSKIDRIFPHTKLLSRLDYMMSL